MNKLTLGLKEAFTRLEEVTTILKHEEISDKFKLRKLHQLIDDFSTLDHSNTPGTIIFEEDVRSESKYCCNLRKDRVSLPIPQFSVAILNLDLYPGVTLHSISKLQD